MWWLVPSLGVLSGGGQLRYIPGAWDGSGCSLQPHLGRWWGRGALTTTSGVQLSGGLLSLCSQCPALWWYKCRHRKKDYNLRPALPLICPPNNGLWFLRQPRLPWHTRLHVWLHWIPVPHICLHRCLHLSPQSSPWLWSPKSELECPAPSWVDGCACQAGACRRVVLTVCAVLSLFWLPQIGYCALLQGSEVPLLFWLISHKWGGFTGYRNLSPHSSLPVAQVPSQFLSCFFSPLFFYPVMWRFSCPFHSLRSSASIQ